MAAPIVIESRLTPTDISQAAKQITQPVKAALNEITNDAKRAAQEIANAFRGIRGSSGGSSGGASGGGGGLFASVFFGSLSATAVIGAIQSVGSAVVNTLQSIGAAAFQSAAQLDKSRQTLIALTGSADAANKKLKELRELANSSPGVTVSLATQAFAQLKAVGTIADETINKLIKSVGKLNAVFSIEDPQGFIRNLTQIFSQGFERADIKEALGRVPIFNQILQQAFKTSDPAALRTLKDSGKLTLETFLKAISDAVENDPRFRNIQESIGSQFEKAKDRVLVALAPIGDQLAAVLLPKLKELAVFLEPFAERVGQQIKDARGEINALIADVIQLGAEFAKTFKQTGLFTSLKDSLESIRKIVQVITVSVATLKDLIELGASGAQFIGTGTFTSIDTGKAAFRSLQGGFANRRRVLQEQADRNFFAGADVIDFGNTFDPKTREQIVGLLDPKTGLPIGTAPGAGFKPPTGSDRGGGGSGQALAQARAIRQAQLQFQKESLEAETQLIKDASERQLDIAKEQYDKGLLATRAYFDLKLGITQETLGNEINLLTQEAAAVQENLSKAKAGSTEQIRLKIELLKINTEIALKTRAIGDAERINLEEFKKALGELEKFDPSKIPGVAISGATITSGPLAGLGATTDSDAQRQARENVKTAATLAREAQAPLIELRTQQLRIQNQVNQGILTEAEGREEILALQRQSRDIQIAILEAQKKTVAGDAVAVAIIDEQIEGLRALGVELNNAQRFMKGFGRETETVGDIFERFGQNVASAFRSTKGLLDNLKSAIKSFFADLLGSALQNSVRSVFGAIFGGGGRGGGGGSPGGIFGTPPFNPGGGSSGGFGGLIPNLGSIFSGGGITVPGSATTPPFNPGFTPGPPGVSGGGIGGFGGILGNLGNLGNLFKGIGFGLPGGSARGGLAGALPLLGIGLGSSLGGSSLFGNILGGVGGGLLGIGLTAAPTGLGALGFLAPLFSNPITAAIGAALLPVAFLFGKAKQRRADEKSSGDALTDAIRGIEQLGRDVASDQVNGADARQIFEDQILANFIAQINQLKTKSVRESRLTNQVRDLRNLFEIDVTPQITAQAARIAKRQAADDLFGKLVPEFAVGGVVPGRDMGFDSVLAKLRPQEMVLTLGQQAVVRAIGGSDIFGKAGVPGAVADAGDGAAFAGGGIASRASGHGFPDAPIVIDTIIVGVGVGQSTAEDIVVVGGSGTRARQVTVNQVRNARTNREL